ncbi:hypothetical protein DBT_1725 [Dissulfuribacter thermophilus]|uniref:Uncharacterized protein n=1 Tax=Dissulfuribacter thermophilus TaxID=1156395 RepID=A0A1B9F4R9_9BACT|nr:hypothetical protein DBT_1725 [Dissulfuribacter thermophilus]
MDVLSFELKEENFEPCPPASGFCTGRACFYLLPSAFYLFTSLGRR